MLMTLMKSQEIFEEARHFREQTERAWHYSKEPKKTPAKLVFS